MGVLVNSGLTAAERKQIEKINAGIAKLAADQDYIAMMADIELESEEDEETEESGAE